MTGFIVFVSWLALGAIGSAIGTHHYRKRFGDAEGLDGANLITVVAGPIGLLGVLFFLTAMDGAE